MNHVSSLVTDHEPLGEKYLPHRLPGREEQLESIGRCLHPVLAGQQPMHLWVHGQPGTGKTATVLHVLQGLQEKHPVQGVLVNCWERASFFEIADEIVAKLKILRAEEHRTSTKLEKLRRHLRDQPLIVVLDEVDKLKPSERSATLYNLASLGRISTVCISNCQDACFELDERVRSRLNFYTVHFPQYSQEQVRAILEERATVSLSPGSWSSQLLARIAEVSSNDARIAIGLLRSAANQAPQDGVLNLSDLQRQRHLAAQAQREQILNSLTLDHRMLYEIICRREKILSPRLWEVYLDRCRRMVRKPLAVRTFSKYTNQLVQLGLVNSQQGRVKGRVRDFEVAK